MTTPPYERRPYRPERLPQAAEQTLDEGSLRTALAIVRSVHQTGEAITYEEPKTIDERWEIAQQLRPVEATMLIAWATEQSAWLHADAFTNR